MTERARKARRALARRAVKDAKSRERLFTLEAGGSPGRPIEVSSASVIETHARSVPCPLCGGALRLDEHAAEGGLRVVRAHCASCGAPRVIYFRLELLS